MTFLEQARAKTDLTGDPLHHVQQLAATWQPAADLSFSDLVLLAPVAGEDGERFVVLAHVRPTTGQTVYPIDLVGSVLSATERPEVARAWKEGVVVEGEGTTIRGDEPVRVQVVPVRHRGRVVAVVSRDARLTFGRQLGELEDHYLAAYERFAVMIAEGSFPFAAEEGDFEDAPRVGDGLIVLQDDLHVRYASPNAVSALHRLGIHSYTSGLGLAELGLAQEGAENAMRWQRPVTDEVERGDVSVTVRTLPLLLGGEVVGALLFVRDVTDLRRRDRLLISKDATIREIHHRVKNNLQTIAALLRLQARRVESPEARAAVQESERQIRSIAIVHETLSREVTDTVVLDDVVRPLVRVVEESVASPDSDLRFEVVGDGGIVAGDVATPLAVVLNELMQNAVDHAFRAEDGRVAGKVTIRMAQNDGRLVVDVIDDGVGLPDDFSLDRSAKLGLSIVSLLVTTELQGTIELSDADGTRVRLVIPLTR